MLKNGRLQLVLLAVPFLVLVPLWDKFPARVPIHWGLNGQPNGWADKAWGVLLVPVTNVALALLLGVLQKLDPRIKNYGVETRASQDRVKRIIGLIGGCFMTGMALLIDVVALGWSIDVVRVTTIGALLLIAALGNYMPKLRPNRFVGIRTPWTLKSHEVWIRTHRIFGKIMLFGSLALLLVCLFLPTYWGLPLLLGFVLLISFGAMAYSYAIRAT